MNSGKESRRMSEKNINIKWRIVSHLIQFSFGFSCGFIIVQLVQLVLRLF